MSITQSLLDLFTSIIATAGYGGVIFLMILESMVIPVPSEAVMPFAGFLWFSGEMSFLPIVFFATLGSIIGSLLSYYIGYYGGRPLVMRFGKYLLLNEHHLDATEKFFAHYGDKAVFVSRFIPVVRHLISLPAGIGKMNIWKFGVYTVVGASLWNSFLAYLGYYLGSRWEEIRKFSEVLDIIIVIVLVVLIIWGVTKLRRR
ncbi:MAG: DedA family protein [Patescibacteria group bacterium]|jgi:membrane protein DedA with SNARE-associated domain